jgi:hypothetical protein
MKNSLSFFPHAHEYRKFVEKRLFVSSNFGGNVVMVYVISWRRSSRVQSQAQKYRPNRKNCVRTNDSVTVACNEAHRESICLENDTFLLRLPNYTALKPRRSYLFFIVSAASASDPTEFSSTCTDRTRSPYSG